MITPEGMIQEIQDVFSNSRPNGFILGWDTNRYFASLTNICGDYVVYNNTDFNYSYCNCFEFKPKVSLGEHDYVITFKISFILDAYSLHVTRYSTGGKTGEVVSEHDCGGMRSAIGKIRRFANKNGLQEITAAEQEIVIDGVALELSEVATLGKCLFDDFE